MAEKKNKFGDGTTWVRGSILGKGGFGSVYLATLKKKKRNNKSCFPSVMAVKSSEVSVSTTLKREREIMRDLQGCPYLIDCFGDETTMSYDGKFLAYNLLLEYCSGGTLDERIKKFGSLPESEVRVYTRCILRGLDHMHANGYVHCDIKPTNILLAPQVNNNGGSSKTSFRAKICDFGLVKREIRNLKNRRVMRESWHGTPMYLSPEAVKDNIQEAPSDIWALGCVVLKMLTGKPVWEGRTVEEIMKKIGAEEEFPITPDYISEEAKDFVTCCLFRNSLCRPTTEMLFDHPFLDGLDEDDYEDEDDALGDSIEMGDEPCGVSEDDSFSSYWRCDKVVDDCVDHYL